MSEGSVERPDVSRQTVTSIFRVEGCDRYYPKNVVLYLFIYFSISLLFWAGISQAV